MIAFVVSVNGVNVGTFGIGESGVLGTHVSWVGRPGESGDLTLSVGGLDSKTNEHMRWPAPPNIKVGDTVTVRVIETDAVDAPTARKTPAQLREEERQLLTEMEAERRARFAAQGLPLPEPPQRQRRVSRDPNDELPPLAAPWEHP